MISSFSELRERERMRKKRLKNEKLITKKDDIGLRADEESQADHSIRTRHYCACAFSTEEPCIKNMIRRLICSLYRQHFWTKIAIFFAKYCNKPVKNYDFANI